MYDDLYSKLEQGRIEPITFWEDNISKWSWKKQTGLYIWLTALYTKEEYNGRNYSELHSNAMQLANYISQQINFQRQMEQERQSATTDVYNSAKLPEILKQPEIKEDFDKAIQIGLLSDYYTLKGSKMLLACFCWGICKFYDKGTIAKSGENKGGFAANWAIFNFIKDKSGRDIDLKQGWQNAKYKNLERKFKPDKIKGFPFWEYLCNELGLNK